jgi:hypothetical protein
LAAGKLLVFIFASALAFPAWAQMDGDDEFNPEAEEFDAGPSVEAELKSEPAPVKVAPEPSAKPGARRQYHSNDDVIFDWSKHQNSTEVPHPFAEKGLLRITRSKVYIYRVEESEQKTATQVRFGAYNPENLESPQGSTFTDNYDQTDNPALSVDWEWQLWKSPIGKWGSTLGAGLYVAQGHGHFAGSKNAHLTPRELFTFAVVPVNAGVVYRLQVWHRQLLIPYGIGGGTIFGFGEFRDDGKAPKWGGSYGAYYGGGVALNLTYFDALSRIALDREYGINAVYLAAEYRGIVGLSKNFDFSSDFVNAGFLMEY